jgi:hypothetical protein
MTKLTPAEIASLQADLVETVKKLDALFADAPPIESPSQTIYGCAHIVGVRPATAAEGGAGVALLSAPYGRHLRIEGAYWFDFCPLCGEKIAAAPISAPEKRS